MLMNVAVFTAVSMVARLNCGRGISVPIRMNGTANMITSMGKSCTVGRTTNRYSPASTTARQGEEKNANTCGAGSSRAAKKQHATAASTTALAPSFQPDAIQRLDEM